MENLYGVQVNNKFDLFIDEDVDPLELIAQQEEAKKQAELKKKKEAEKGKKPKSGKKSVLKTENKNKVIGEIEPKKEEKLSSARQNDRPRTGGRQNREPREPREQRDDTDRRPPRRRDENMNPETRERQDRGERPERFNQTDRSEGGFGRNEGGFQRGEGGFQRSEGGFSRSDGGFSRNEGGFSRNEGVGRGEGGFGRGGRGRGRGGGRGGRGGGGRGGFGKREFDRHSGSERTSGVKATEKREGGGAHNWGTVRDDLDPPPKVDYWRDPKEQLKDPEVEPTTDWTPQAEDAENQDPNESTESAEPNEEENQPKQMTLDEWKKMQEKNRMKSDFKLRRAGEGVDNSQWKTGREYRKSEGDEEESGEEEEESDEEEDEEAKNKRLVNEIKITFNDSPRRGRGGRRPRGVRGGRGSGRGSDRKNPNAAPKFDDETDFPMLVKIEA